VVLLLEGLRSHEELAIREYGGHEDLRGSDRRSVIPYCRSGFTTLPPVPLQEQPAVVLLLEGLRSHEELAEGIRWSRGFT
jgi:hypothetical protein